VIRRHQFLRLLVTTAISMTLAACNDIPTFSTTRVVEVKCVTNTGLDQDKKCLQPERLRSELEIRVNPTTQQVHFSFLNSRGEPYLKDFILDDCSVVDSNNWRCTRTMGERGTSIYMVSEYGMSGKRYHQSLTGNGSPEFYTSGISGLTYWAYRYGLISGTVAMKFWGYSETTRLL
jgi:hypothetical protein